jgi:hypothetical protein
MTGLNSVYRKSWTGGLSRRPEAVIESLKSLGSIESDRIDSGRGFFKWMTAQNLPKKGSDPNGTLMHFLIKVFF